MKGFLSLILTLALTLASAAQTPPPSQHCDVLVYAATPAGVIAAVAAAREGRSVILIEPAGHVGGMVSGGLGWTDFGRASTLGGYAREFFNRVRDHYTKSYGPDSAQAKACFGGMYFEPHVAEDVFRHMLAEARVTVLFHTPLDPAKVERSANRITALTTADGLRYEAALFIDASYEGDLMAAAGVSHRVGREGRDEYDESLAPPETDHKVQAYNFRLCLTQRQDIFVPIPKPADYDASLYDALAATLATTKPPHLDNHVLKLSPLPNGKTDVNNGGPWSTDWPGHSADYPDADPTVRRRIWLAHQNYDQGLLYFLAHDPRVPDNLRREMLTWGLCKDEFTDVPASSAAAATHTFGWPHQLYVREARRMTGLHVMTEQDVLKTRWFPRESICVGSYTIDCHAVGATQDDEGHWHAEPGLFSRIPGPYEIPYGVLVPRIDEAENLLVPVCCSATHVAYGTIRMEPVYMMLAHAAGVAASQAIESRSTVQHLNVVELRKKLAEQKQILVANHPPTAAFDVPENVHVNESVQFTDRSTDVDGVVKSWAWDFDGNGNIDSREPNPHWKFPVAKAYTVTLVVNDGEDPSEPVRRVVRVLSDDPNAPPPPDDILIDDEDAKFTGPWIRSSSAAGFIGKGYHHDGDAQKGKCQARFTPNVLVGGKYDVLVYYVPLSNRARNALVVVHSADGEHEVRIDQRSGTAMGNFRSVGTFPFAAGKDGWVEIRNDATDGHVVIDAVKFVYGGPVDGK
jgi:hypothetical protein